MISDLLIIGPFSATTTPGIAATAGNGVFAKGQQESVTTITFTGISAADAESRLSASIDWGDGTSSGGSIVQQSAGVFAVTSTHTYANAGVFTGLVTLTDNSSGDTLAMANYSATVVAVTSITATDNNGSGNSVTTTSTNAGLLCYIPNDDGSGSVSLAARVSPGTPAAYGATAYEVVTSDGTEVASGAINAAGTTISLPSEPDTKYPFTVEAGTDVGGNFLATQAVSCEPRKIRLSYTKGADKGNGPENRLKVSAGHSANFDGIEALDQNGNSAADVAFQATAVNLTTMTVTAAVNVTVAQNADGAYSFTIGVPPGTAGTEFNVTVTVANQPGVSIVIYVVAT